MTHPVHPTASSSVDETLRPPIVDRRVGVMNVSNPYDVERNWPDYFLEHRRLTVERQGTYRCGNLPVWTIRCPGIVDKTDAIVETTTSELASPSETPPEGTSGSSNAYAQLMGVLDRTVTRFYMHQR
jgi:hypothetical protein